MTNLRRTALASLLGLMLHVLPSAALAGQQEQDEDKKYPQALEELIRTEVVFPQEKGELQISAGSLFDHSSRSSLFGLPLEVEYGLTDSWQVGLEWTPFTRLRVGDQATTERGEIAIGTKYSFMSIAGSGSHAAVGVELVVGELEVEPYAAFARDLNRRGAQVFAHVGLGFAASGHGDDEGERELQWNVGGLAPVGPVTLAAEINARNHSLTFRGVTELYLTPSITFRPARSWEIGCGMPIGLTSDSTRVGLAVLVSFEQ